MEEGLDVLNFLVFNKNGKRSVTLSDFYFNSVEIEINEWLADLVKKACEEAQS